jgi:hypothetical protein
MVSNQSPQRDDPENLASNAGESGNLEKRKRVSDNLAA